MKSIMTTVSICKYITAGHGYAAMQAYWQNFSLSSGKLLSHVKLAFKAVVVWFVLLKKEPKTLALWGFN
jgi:hypothetical protein